MKLTRESLFLTAVCLVFTPFSRASLITYTNRTTWTGNSSSVSNITFEGIAPTSQVVSEIPSLTLSGVNFEGYNLGTQSLVNRLYVVDQYFHANPPPYPQFPYDRGTGASLQGPNADPSLGGTPGDGLLVTLPGGGSTSVGADFWAVFNEKTLVPTALFEVSFLNGSTDLGDFTFNTLSYPAVQFFGVTSSTSITQIFIQSLGGVYTPYGTNTPVNGPSSWIEMDNFSTGTAGQVTSAPEPSSIVLTGALVGLWMFLSRVRSALHRAK
jgi:hypothetical protein